MLLKRHYDPATLDSAAPVCTHVVVKHTGTSPEQNFSSRLVAQAIGECWMSIDGDRLGILAEPEPLQYRIVRVPGTYCVHDGQRIPISDIARDERARTGVGRLSAAEAQAYLAAHGFAGKASPDPAHPSGYQVIDHYECVLAAEQHARFKAGA